jgi:hypothetical protein
MRDASLFMVAVLAITGCDPAPIDQPDAGGGADVGASDTGAIPGEDTGTPAEDGGDPDSGPPDMRREAFLANLDGTVWSGLATRTETGGDIERAFEMRFQGGGTPMWGEIRNPYGPARLRILRFVRIAAGACTSDLRCEVTTTISIPDASWETPSALRGRMETWTIEIIEGSPRAIAITSASTGIEEILDEGAWPVPTSGLTADVRVFHGGSGNPISDAFCSSGAIFSSDIDRAAIWEFARGGSAEPTLGQDLAGGVLFAEWNDIDNRFGIRDVDGFGIADLGGSERTDQFYFLVRYRGVVDHPGGRFQIREADDAVEDAVWAFIGAGVGGTEISDLFLEVHHFAAPDETSDEPSVTLPAGEVPIEIIVPRCEMDFESAGQVRVEMRLGTASYDLVSRQPIRPIIDDVTFPPVL